MKSTPGRKLRTQARHECLHPVGGLEHYKCGALGTPQRHRRLSSR